MGIAQSPEGRHCFPRMTVRENLELGAYLRRDRDGIDEDMDRVFDLFPRLQGAREAEGGHDVRRRAADARDRPRADGPARSCCCSTSRRWASRRSSSSGSTRRSSRSTARARRSCSSSRTRTTRSRSPSAPTCWRPGTVALTDASAALRENPEVQTAYLGARMTARARAARRQGAVAHLHLAARLDRRRVAVGPQGLRREAGPGDRAAAERARRRRLAVRARRRPTRAGSATARSAGRRSPAATERPLPPVRGPTFYAASNL